MDFDAVADDLFVAAREDFTALRDERAQEARADRQDELARQIQGLRKPTVAAWLINQVSRWYPDEIGQLADLGEALRAAHHALAGETLRSLSRQRHGLIKDLTGRARSIAREAGQSFSDATAAQVEDTLAAAIANAAVAEAVLGGRLSASLTAGSPDGWLTVAPAPAAASRAKKTPQQPVRRATGGPGAGRAEPGPSSAALDRARQDVRDTARTRDEAAGALAEAEREAEQAASAAVELRERLTRLRDQLDEATQREHRARQLVATARKASFAADRAADTAERQLDRLGKG